MQMILNSQLKERFEMWAGLRLEQGWTQAQVDDVYEQVRQDITTKDDLLRADCTVIVHDEFGEHEESAVIADRNERRLLWFNYFGEEVGLTQLGITPKEQEVKKLSVDEAVTLLLSVKSDAWREAWLEKAGEEFGKGYLSQVKTKLKKAVQNAKKK